eukprot:symbB.v1.2.025823.t1/scaffold2533.1/size76754/4
MASMMELYRNEMVDLLTEKSGGTSPKLDVPVEKRVLRRFVFFKKARDPVDLVVKTVEVTWIHLEIADGSRKGKSQRPETAAMNQKLNVCLDENGAVQIEHLHEEECKTAQALTDVVEHGNQIRTLCATKMNRESSRSNLILIIRVVGVNEETKQKLSGKILLCDLAGSERLKESDEEATEINKSLSALGDVMEALLKGIAHVPCENHKLTQVMSDALGGTSKTLMFVNCSPASSSFEETLLTLKFAARAKPQIGSQAKQPTVRVMPVMPPPSAHRHHHHHLQPELEDLYQHARQLNHQRQYNTYPEAFPNREGASTVAPHHNLDG